MQRLSYLVCPVSLTQRLGYFSSSILLISVPTPCETKTLNSSSCLSILLGFAFHPTPGGVLDLQLDLSLMVHVLTQ
jgi:hypothetical protein